MRHTTWAEDTAARVATAIRTARGKRSAQWLADRTAELGHPVSRASIANLEVGRRKTVDLADLLVLARALDVPPALLLVPLGVSGDAVEVVPGEPLSDWDAFRWFTGATDRSGIIALFRKHEDACDQVQVAYHRKATATAWAVEDADNPDEVARHTRVAERAVEDGEDAQRAVLELRTKMREAGVVPPPLPAGVDYLASHEVRS